MLFSELMLTEWWVCGRQLSAGKLLDLGVTDGSKLTLVPVIEAGLVVSINQYMLNWGVGLIFTNLTPCSVFFFWFYFQCSTTKADRSMLEVLENLTEAQVRVQCDM